MRRAGFRGSVRRRGFLPTSAGFNKAQIHRLSFLCSRRAWVGSAVPRHDPHVADADRDLAETSVRRSPGCGGCEVGMYPYVIPFPARRWSRRGPLPTTVFERRHSRYACPGASRPKSCARFCRSDTIFGSNRDSSIALEASGHRSHSLANPFTALDPERPSRDRRPDTSCITDEVTQALLTRAPGLRRAPVFCQLSGPNARRARSTPSSIRESTALVRAT